MCWDTIQHPLLSDNKNSQAGGLGSFLSILSGLSPSTTYYVRAYAENHAGISYGNEVSFQTSERILNDGKIRDIDGNAYDTVRIGTQVWMMQNLRTTRYRNGDMVANVTDNTLWTGLTTGAYCNYNNDTLNANIYGPL